MQIVPPDNHQALLAERAIQTFKSHFIASLCGTDSSFPIQAWDLLLPQAEITLNLLWEANANPKLLAYEYLFGQFNFRKTPMAPMGIKAVMHEQHRLLIG